MGPSVFSNLRVMLRCMPFQYCTVPYRAFDTSYCAQGVKCCTRVQITGWELGGLVAGEGSTTLQQPLGLGKGKIRHGKGCSRYGTNGPIML